MLGLFWVALVARGEAACPSTSADVQAALDQATAAFAAMDPKRFGVARAEAEVALGCLSEPISLAAAASYHRVDALDGYLARQPERTVLSFRVALGLEPAWELPLTIAPKGNPLRKQFDEAHEGTSFALTPFPVPEGTALWVDGHVMMQRPAGQPAILQRITTAGAVQATVHVPAGAAPPDWGPPPVVAVVAPVVPPVEPVVAPVVVAPVVAVVEPPTAVPERRKRPTVALAAGAGGAAIGSAVLYGLAVQTRGTFEDEATAQEDLEGLQGKANGLGYAAQAGALAAVGLGLGAVVTVAW